MTSLDEVSELAPHTTAEEGFSDLRHFCPLKQLTKDVEPSNSSWMAWLKFCKAGVEEDCDTHMHYKLTEMKVKKCVRRDVTP